MKTQKEKKFVIEAKCDELGYKTEEEFDDPKIANKSVSNVKKWIGEELIKREEY